MTRIIIRCDASLAIGSGHLLRCRTLARELKQCDDLNPYRDWFLRVLKYANKLQETVDSDFIQEFGQLQSAQSQLIDAMQRNEELERQN